MDFSIVLSFVSTSTTTTSAAASRPFTAAFFLTLFGRLVFETQLALAGDTRYTAIPLLANVTGMALPLWMISETMLFVLGLLMLAEWYSESNDDIRVILEDLKTSIVKPGANALMQFGVVSGQGAAVVGLLAANLPQETLLWLASLGSGVRAASAVSGDLIAPELLASALGWVVTAVAIIWAALMAAATWILAALRQGVVELLGDLDDGDSLGLLRLLGFAEGGWTITLTVVMIAAPLLAFILVGLTLLCLFLVRKWFERQDERSKVPCEACGTSIYPMALFCPSCRTPVERPQQVGVFGQARAAVVSNRTAHRLQLTARKRCPSCAAKLPARRISQSCSACGTVTFANVSEVNMYLRSLDRKVPQTLIICGLLGVVPLVGLVPGIVYYRLSLIASLRGYIPSTIGCFTRWGVRLASAVLVMLQPFFLGWLTLPALALLNYAVYRHVLRAGIGALPQTNAAQYTAPGAPVLAAPPAVVPMTAAPIARQSCSACGADNVVGSRYCTGCGAHIAE